MRAVKNRAQGGNYPKQEQEAITNFVSAAPGLHIGDCGGALMPECVNMSIKQGRLELRQPMRSVVREEAFAGIDGAGRSFIATAKIRHDDRAEDAYFFIDGSGKICRMEETGRTEVETSARLNGSLLPDSGDKTAWARLLPFHGPLALVRTEQASRILDLRGSARARELGLVVPIANQITKYISPTRWAGVEYAVKNEDGVVVRSSGVTRCGGDGGITIEARGSDLVSELESNEITHARIYLSHSEGNPHELYLMFDVPIDGIKNATIDNPYEQDGNSAGWSGSFAFLSELYLQVIWTAGSEEPSINAKEMVMDEKLIDLIPMENAFCFAGGRLWGIYPEEPGCLIYSAPSGFAWQEQRSPIAVIILGLSDIIDMAPLNGDLYVFCEKGVARIAGCDPESKPQAISGKGGKGMKIFPVDGFGIFIVLNGTLMFMDKSTLEISSMCKGMDLNLWLGDWVNVIDSFEFFAGELYFIAGIKLFKINLLHNLGISEIEMSGGYAPLSMCGNGDELAILYRREREKRLSVWGAQSLEAFLSEMEMYEAELEAFERIERIDYRAMFAKSAQHGWVEHWDTAVVAKLIDGSAVETEDLCDGFLYEESGCFNKIMDDMPQAREYLATAGRENGRRPIGKTIGVRVRVRMPEMNRQRLKEFWQKNLPALLQAKLTTISQPETFNINFCPNKHEFSDGLATESDIRLLPEEAGEDG